MRTRRSGEARVARTAAIIPVSATKHRLTTSSGMASSWQAKVRDYDLNGPGVCGYYLDLVSTLASLCPLTVEVKQTDGKWVTSDDSVLNTILAGYQSPIADQSELVAMHVRHRESMGECWLIHSRDDAVGWTVETRPNVVATQEGVRFTDTYGIVRTVSTEAPTLQRAVWWSVARNPYMPNEPFSPIRRALGDLRRLRSATRSQTRASESRLVMNGMIAFPEGDGSMSMRPLAEQMYDLQGNPIEMPPSDKVLDDYFELAKLAVADDDSPAAVVPYAYIGPEAKVIDLGREVDNGTLEVEKAALEGFARAVNFPAQLLTTGPGSANHWNEWVLQDVQVKMGLAPKLLPVCADITRAHLRPWITFVKQQHGYFGAGSSTEIPTDHIRVGFDTSYLTAKPDVTGQLIEAYTYGAISRAELGERLNIPEILALPEGMSEFDFWKIATDHRDPEDTQQGSLANGLPDMAPGGGPVTPGLTLPESADSTVVTPSDFGAANQAAPAPPAAITAAAGPGTQTVLDTLGTLDQTLYASLHASAQACADQATRDAVREIIRAHPPQSDDRARLRDLPVEEVWVSSAPDVRSHLDLRAVVAKSIAECVRPDELRRTATSIAVAVAILGISREDLDLDPDIGALVLAAGVTTFVVNRFTKGKGSSEIPAGLPLNAMSAAGGAAVSADGDLVRDHEGRPVPRQGGSWQGNNGMATGSAVIRAVVQMIGPGEIEWEWRHAMFRTPREPWAPHVALHHQRFASPLDVVGDYVGSHFGCTCGWLLHISKGS